MPIGLNGQQYNSEFEALYASVTPDFNQEFSDVSAATTSMQQQGNIDLTNRPKVQNGKDISTVRSASFNFGDGETLLPTVSDDGRLLSNEEAIQQFRDTGKHLGKFSTPDEATRYAEFLHNSQAETLPSGSTQTQGGTNLPAPDLNASAGNVEQTRGIVDKLLGTTGERYQTWPEKAIRGAISAMALPGDVLSGKVEPGSVQEIERAMDLAGLMVMGPAPVASKLADGTLGSFAGVKSKTLDKNKLAEAQIMEHNGASADAVWEKTGFFRGADDRWRFEIPDAVSTLNESAWRIRKPIQMDGSTAKVFDVPHGGTTLVEALNHPELFKAYPHLKDIKIKPLPRSLYNRNVIGQMSEDTMYLREGLDSEFLRSVILHELQHSIQSKEGFARGGSTLEFKSPALAEAETLFNKVKTETEDELMKTHGWSERDIRQRKDLIRTANEFEDTSASSNSLNLFKNKHPDAYKRLKDIVASEDLLKEQTNKQSDQYRRLIGEVESRNVQSRMDLDEITRKYTHPKSTEDVPRDQQINKSR